MEQFEREATIGSADSTSLPGGGLPTAIDSLTHLENYYQSKYEHYLAMATEAKENKERVSLLLLDLDRDAVTLENNSIESSSVNGQQNNRSRLRQSSDNGKASSLLPSTELNEEEDPVTVETERGIQGSDFTSDHSFLQMRRFLKNLSIAMSVIESVSNSDSGKTLHQNYLHHLLNRELDLELSVELVELYLEEATRRGYLEPDEFNNNCYIAKPKSETFGEQNEDEDLAIDSAIANRLSGRKSNKPYDLPPSDQLKPTLLETVEGYIEKNRPTRFSIDDVIDYLYPQPVRSDWNKVERNKVRTSISNVLSRKAYLGKHWSRIKPGVYRPRTSK